MFTPPAINIEDREIYKEKTYRVKKTNAIKSATIKFFLQLNDIEGTKTVLVVHMVTVISGLLHVVDIAVGKKIVMHAAPNLDIVSYGIVCKLFCKAEDV